MNLIKKVIIVTVALTLTGCHSDNPLLKQKNLVIIKANLDDLAFVDSDQSRCINFYANYKKDERSKTLCSTWSQKFYNNLLDSRQISDNYSLDQLRDVKVWQKIKEIK